jgi:hypothetical protein
MNTTIGELSQASRPLFNIVYCNNSLITFLDDIPIKYESGETTRAMGVLGKPIQYLSCSRFFWWC